MDMIDRQINRRQKHITCPDCGKVLGSKKTQRTIFRRLWKFFGGEIGWGGFLFLYLATGIGIGILFGVASGAFASEGVAKTILGGFIFATLGAVFFLPFSGLLRYRGD